VGLGVAAAEGDHAVARAVKYTGMVALAGVVAFSWHESLQAAWNRALFDVGQRQIAAAAKFLDDNLAHDAVVFTRGAAVYHLGTRRAYTLYDVGAFSPGRRNDFPDWLEPGTAEWYAQPWYLQSRPRQQPSRLEKFRKFYESTTDEQLRGRQAEIIRSALDRGRQVVLLLPAGEGPGWSRRLGEDLDVTTTVEANLFGGRWGLHEVTVHHADLHAAAGPLRAAIRPVLRVDRPPAPAPKQVEMTVRNPFDQPLRGTLRWRAEAGSPWRLPAEAVEVHLAPGQERTFALPAPDLPADLARLPGALEPLPEAVWRLAVGERLLWPGLAVPVTVDAWPFEPGRSTLRDAADLQRLGAIKPPESSPAEIELKLRNPTTWPAEYDLAWHLPPRCRWQAEPATASVTVAPGAEAAARFELGFAGQPHELLPLPRLVASVRVDGAPALRVESVPRVDGRETLARGEWRVDCPRLAQAPRIDGRLDDAAWGEAALAADFVAGADQPARYATEVRLGWDERCLYLAFRCAEPNLAGLVLEARANDRWAWTDDSVELLLDMNRDRRSYFHYVLTAAAIVYDAVGNYNHDWDGPCTARAGREKDAWTLEVAIPWKSLAAPPPQPGQQVGIELSRNRAGPPRETSQWAPTFRGNHAPDRFGTMTFR